MLIRDIKAIKAVLDALYDNSWWNIFHILSSEGAVIQDIQFSEWADYSPTIYELIQEGKLLGFR